MRCSDPHVELQVVVVEGQELLNVSVNQGLRSIHRRLSQMPRDGISQHVLAQWVQQPIQQRMRDCQRQINRQHEELSGLMSRRGGKRLFFAGAFSAWA